MINLTLSQARNRQPLSGSTTFNRIVVPGTRDPLNGIGSEYYALDSSASVFLFFPIVFAQHLLMVFLPLCPSS